jgi:hypothetical protein
MPNLVRKFAAAASGHSDFVRVDEDKLAKPCNPHEAKVYFEMKACPQLLPFTATFHGFLNGMDIGVADNVHKRRFQTENRYIVLDDLTHGYMHPCVMDLKLGTKQYTVDTPHEKRKKRKVKAVATTSARLGFRLGGVRVYKSSLKEWCVKKSSYGKRLTERTFEEALHFYFNDGKRLRTELIPRFIDKLKQLLKAMETHSTCFDFIASSVLLIYEGAPYSKGSLSAESRGGRLDVKLIDFDHTVIKSENPALAKSDSGAAYGIRNLIKMLEVLLFSSSKTLSYTDLPSLAAEDFTFQERDDSILIKNMTSNPPRVPSHKREKSL